MRDAGILFHHTGGGDHRPGAKELPERKSKEGRRLLLTKKMFVCVVVVGGEDGVVVSGVAVLTWVWGLRASSGVIPRALSRV